MQHEAVSVLQDAGRDARLHRASRLALRDPARVRLEDREHLLVMGDRLALEQAAVGLVDLAHGVRQEAPDFRDRPGRRAVRGKRRHTAAPSTTNHPGAGGGPWTASNPGSAAEWIAPGAFNRRTFARKASARESPGSSGGHQEWSVGADRQYRPARRPNGTQANAWPILGLASAAAPDQARNGVHNRFALGRRDVPDHGNLNLPRGLASHPEATALARLGSLEVQFAQTGIKSTLSMPAGRGPCLPMPVTPSDSASMTG